MFFKSEVPMKKLSILTSVLALTACGGGSGGVGVSVPAPNVPDEVINIVDFDKVTEMQVLTNNEAERTAYVKSVLGDDFYSDASGAAFNPTRGATPEK